MDTRSENIATNVVIPRLHKEMLKLLSRKTRITQSEYMREAVIDLLHKYGNEFKGTRFDSALELKGEVNRET